MHFHAASKQWFLLHYEDVGFGLADIKRDAHNSRDPLNPFAMDGPDHTGPRRLIAAAFANRAMQALAGRAQAIVDDALAGKGPGAELRLVDEIGYPLPYRMMCHLLGVPELDDVVELRDNTFKSLGLIDAFLTPEQIADYMAAAKWLYEHLDEVIEWKRAHLGDDLVSMVLAGAAQGEVMTDQNVVPFLHTLYLAGMHTTVNQTALSVLALMRNRAQWERLVAQPDLIDTAVEELLRYDSTAQYMVRTASEPLEFGDVMIPERARIVCWIASANRDEARFGANADELDITRNSARNHIAFGKGAHVCIGSWLARLEVKTVLQTLVTRYPNLELADQDLDWSTGTTAIRGPAELVLRLNP